MSATLRGSLFAVAFGASVTLGASVAGAQDRASDGNTPVAAADPATRASAPPWDPARDTTRSRAALFADATWSAVFGPIVGRFNFTGGTTIALRPNLALVIEGGYETGCVPRRYDSGCTTGYFGGTLSVGLAVTVAARRALEGFFVQPKVMLAAFAAYPNRAIGPQLALVSNYVAGVDVGYQITRGHFYTAVSAGFTLGVGIGTDRVPSSFPPEDSGEGTLATSMMHGVGPVRGLIAGFSPLTIRIGLAF